MTIFLFLFLIFMNNSALGCWTLQDSNDIWFDIQKNKKSKKNSKDQQSIHSEYKVSVF